MNPIYDDIEHDSDNVVSVQDCINRAEHYIRVFFRGKKDEYGSLIDPEDLINDRNISLTLNMTICDHMPIVYKALEQVVKEKKKGKIPDDISLVLKLFNECSRLSIPKNLATGLISLYVETCKGCKLDI